MADLQDRLRKLARVEQEERFRELILKIGRLRDDIILNLFQIHDEDLRSLKEDRVKAAADELHAVAKAARKLQEELEG